MEDDEITIKQIAQHLKVNPYTVYRWIEWYYSDLLKPANIYLPDFTLKGVAKVYKKKDLIFFENFRKNLSRGDMSKYNQYRFGNKKVINNTKEKILKSKDNQNKIKYKYGNGQSIDTSTKKFIL